MNLFEFLRNLEAFYPLNESEDKVNKRLSSYVDILEGEIVKSGKKYNYDKVLKYIQMNYRYKQFPSLPDILEFMVQGEVKEIAECKDEGCLVVVTMPNGVKYPFEVAPFGKSVEEIKKHVISNYGNVEVRIYPKGTLLIGNEVFT